MVSVLPLTHGLLVPDVLYGPNDATLVAALAAVPAGSPALLPWLAPDSRWANAIIGHWRRFVVAHLIMIFSLAALLLIAPGLVPLPPAGSLTRAGIIALSVGACAVASWRQVSLAAISQRMGSLGIAVGFAIIGSAPLMFEGAVVFGPGFWLAHGLDAAGVLLGGVLGWVAYRRQGTMHEILAPLEVASPLRALVVGLDPLVHRFVADLDRKDPITRDHVIRTARLAVRLAAALRLPPAEVRNVGVAAILHDVGKLEIPDAILHKPGPLTAEELDVIRGHAAIGFDLLRDTKALRTAAALVRGHHERWDGAGYPDELAGEEIPLGARIVAVCDGFDAMSQTRQYRSGMELETVREIMRTGAGSQWDERLVALLWRLVDSEVHNADREVLDDVGRGSDPAGDPVLDCCIDAVSV